MKCEVQLDIEEGDILVFNDEEWEVTDIVMGSYDVKSVSGNLDSWYESEIEKNIRFSGKFSLIKKDFIGVV